MEKYLLIFLTIILQGSSSVIGQPQWQREFEAIVNGDTLSGAYAGGLKYARIKLVDIDADGDLDVLISNYWHNEGVTKIVFYRNDGTPEKPKWIFVTDHFNELAIKGQILSLNFVDIDADDDYDLLVGASDPPHDSYFYYYCNIGTAYTPNFKFVTDNYNSIDIIDPAPVFVDIDGDGDLDMFISSVTLYFYRNDGSPGSPDWTFITAHYDSTMIGCTIPSFVDIDADGDYDLFTYDWLQSRGSIFFYRNEGNANSAIWKLESENFNSLDVTYNCIPEFADIDNDGDFDVFLNGHSYSNAIHFFRNKGNKSIPDFIFETDQLFNMPIRGSYPTFVDIDNDKDYDLFIGGQSLYDDKYFYRNDGTSKEPNWTFIVGDFYTDGIKYFNGDLQFVDIDADGDFDLFIASDRYIRYYRNDGDTYQPYWNLVTNDFLHESIPNLRPDFVDIDADGDYDLFIGAGGLIWFYVNNGDAQNPHFTQDSTFSLDISNIGIFPPRENFGGSVNPTLVDWDNDGDFDLAANSTLHGMSMLDPIQGHVFCFRNDGTNTQKKFIFDPIQTSNFGNMVRGINPNPTFVDIDGDSDMDLFQIFNGGLVFYRNMLISSVTDDNTTLQDLPNTFSLAQNYPNPFNAMTTIQYLIPEGQYNVKLKIYNIMGKEVMTLVDQKQNSGECSFIWNGKDKRREEVSSGIYFYELKAGSFRQVKKLLLLR